MNQLKAKLCKVFKDLVKMQFFENMPWYWWNHIRLAKSGAGNMLPVSKDKLWPVIIFSAGQET
jgi:hypothetical protein